jgi:sugar lactone lactonase YvrE
MRELKVLLDGLLFGEGPRWHDDRLFFSDMHAHKVMAVDMQGHAEVVAEVPAWPSGLGWLPDGRMLIVSMTDRRLLRLDADGLKEFADLSKLASFHCNDMVVDGKGRAYVGNFGFDLIARAELAPAEMVLVTPDGAARVVARELLFPNGTVIKPDGATLIVAETFRRQLTAFDIEPAGSLSNRRVWAELGNVVPDGTALDAEGAIWVASPRTSEVVRVKEGGAVAERIKVAKRAFACALGGPGRRTLFVMTASSSLIDECNAKRDGRVEITEVDVPGAGWP